MQMLPTLISSQKLTEWNRITANARRAVVTAHASPDGDAVGSCLALAGWLRRRGVDVTVVLPDRLPDFLMWLPGADAIVCYDRAPREAEVAAESADLLLSLDHNDTSRTATLAPVLEKCQATRVVIDHHPEPKINAALTVCRPEMCSTCEVVFRLLWQLGAFEEMTRDEAVCLYCGMMTDTGGFTYNSSHPEIFFIISQLLTKGFDKDRVYRNVYNNYSPDRVRLTGYVLYKKLHFYPGLHACYYTLTADELRRFNFQRGDTEGLVNMPLAVKGMRLSVAFREDAAQGKIRVSLRSVDDFPCNRLSAEFFGGGGHLNAAGGEVRGTIDDAVALMDNAVRKYRDLLE